MRIGKHMNQLWRRTRHSNEHWYTYLFFVVLRVVLVFIPQLGYVHPDEFFQTVEVMTGDHFQLEHIRSWEFNAALPLRSITLPFLLLRLAWSFFEFFAYYAYDLLHIQLLHSYTYLVFPRFIYCLISFVNDWCLYRICCIYSLKHEIRLLAMGSSWVLLVFGTRTFSNSIEMVFCSLLLMLVAECMIKTNTIVYKKEFLEEKYDKATSIGERVKLWKLKNALPTHNFKHLFAVSSICVAGVFNRPTFLLFGAPMVFHWMLRGMGSKSITFADFNLRMLLFVLSALPTLLLFIFCDSLYYKYLTAGELMMRDLSIENFVFTPWNFIKYNLDPNKTAEHGLHPKYIHLLVNIPLLYNVLGIIAMVSFAQLMLRFFRAEYQDLPRSQTIIGLMSAAIFVPLFFLSLINHQEARFLLPLTFPIMLLHAPKLLTGFCAEYPFKEQHPLLMTFYKQVLCTRASAKYLLKTWYICNIVLTVFFGFIHQAGVFPLAQHLEHIHSTKPLLQHMHLVSSHMYSLPLTFVNMRSSQLAFYDRATGKRLKRPKDFYYYEYGSLELPKLLSKIKLIMSHCEMKLSKRKQKYRLYLAIPNSLSEQLSHLMHRQRNVSDMDYELQRIFYPHLSTEALPRVWGAHHACDVHPPDWASDDLKGTCSIDDNIDAFSLNALGRQLSIFVHQFGLALYQFEPKRVLLT